MNQATTPSSAEARPHKWYRLPLSSDQREELDSAVRAYFQNVGLSSKGKGIQQTELVLFLLCCDILPDGTQVALIEGDFFGYRGGEEPHPLLLSEGIPDSPAPDYDNASDMDWYESCSSQPFDECRT